MAFQYHFVLPPTGQADNAVVREMFDDIKAYLDSFVPSGGAAPSNATYVTLTTNATLTNERVLTAGTAINLTDNGAGSTIVVTNTGVTSAIAGTGISVSAATGAVTITNTGVTSITGTANQVIASASTGAVTLSLPQSIDTAASVQFSRLLLDAGSMASKALYWANSGSPIGFDNQLSGTIRASIDSSEIAAFTVLGSRFTAQVTSPKFRVDAGTSSAVTIQQSGGGSAYTLTLPINDGSSDEVLTTDGSGILSWTSRAKTDLSNLASTAVNVSIKPASPGAIDLGNTTLPWANVITEAVIIMQDSPGTRFTSFISNPSMAANVAYTLPTDDGTSNQYLTTDGSGGLSWTNAAGTGTVNTGTANHLAYYATSTNAVSSLTAITASKVLVSDTNGLPVAATTSTTEINYVAGVTSAIQTQLDDKLDNDGDSIGGNLIFLNQAGVQFREQTGNGLNDLTIEAPNALTASTTWKLPDGNGSSGQVLTTDGANPAVLTWATASGTGANTALSNLASVAINTTLLPGTDNSIDLGSTSKRWVNIFGKDIDLGASGTAGSVDIFPSTASKGKITISAADSAGNTTTTITNASQAGARTYIIPDAGADASFVMTEGTQTINGTKTFSSDVNINATKKLYLDGGGDTYIIESSSNIIKFFTGATERFRIDNGNNRVQTIGSTDFAIAATQALYLDGGGDTYIKEASANVLETYTAGNKAVSISAAGEITQPLQPSFLVTNGTGATDVTGDATAYTQLWPTEIYDQGANFSSNTFTAPITGRYHLSASVYLKNILITHTLRYVRIITSNRSYFVWFSGALAESDKVVSVNAIADMDSGDTAFVTVEVDGSTKTVDILGDATGNYFSGSLIN